MFCLMAWALAELGDYLEANEDALRNRYDR